KLRDEAAEMLGYPTTAAFEDEVRMSKTPATVEAFYAKLRPLVREKALTDRKEYTDMLRSVTGDPKAELQPWDQWYVETLLKNQKYSVDEKVIEEYFPMEKVVEGLFNITQNLYGIEYKDVTADAKTKAPYGWMPWDPDVKLYEVWDKKSKEMLGWFYTDLYPRPNKYSHAACWGLVPRKKWSDGTIEKPVAALVCNFNKSTPDKPSLLPHDQVETFFHEFGHCLHNILTKADTSYFAGTNVELDFVEAPSQMMENWVWDADVLKTFARHYKTGQPLPDDLLNGMIAARRMGSGLFTEHQFYYGLVDETYHTAAHGEVDTTKVARELYPQIETYSDVPGVYFQASFGHLINGYTAGYYGYQWSLVYAQDMFQRFKELGLLSPEAGAYYREKILSRGGTMDAFDMLKDYLGREPNMDAYLEYLGLKTQKSASAAQPAATHN
ncbi:MAG TPA: M3 family metallopeptidase, partial [Phycisphaerales bacterium]|nr:M3 family metallopeptidase [Phycisphaerales bacterium]